ncbi:MAG: tetratricopeptide repeat protein [Anaerolineae bacterium]|nr:tetratricopeptide repeat protein [Anaerolineae bacterium]
MGRLTRTLWSQFQRWERPSKIAFGLAAVLLVLVLLALIFGPFEARQPVLIGLVGLVIITQVIFMWANRRMTTPYAQAQQCYLDGDFEGACSLLEELRAAGKADVRALTLLGNAYRQQAQLERSEAILLEALNIRPNHHFPLYGFGRTLLIQGRYDEAANAIEQALASGAPPVVQVDAGEAYYRGGQQAEALRLLKAALDQVTEPHRQLMGQYLRYRMGGGPRPDPALVAVGLAYWQAHAQRYQDTAYGQALAEDVRAMQRILEEV